MTPKPFGRPAQAQDTVSLPVIGRIHSPLAEKFGVPRQPGLVGVQAMIELFPPYDDPLAVEGLEAFSHLWVIWQFHQNRSEIDLDGAAFRPLIRPPRLGGNTKIGVFASRSMYRPAPLGLSVVRLISLTTEANRTRLIIEGSDMVDGTPVIDIKPYLAYVDAVPDARSSYAQIAPQTLTVCWSEAARQQARELGLLEPQCEMIAALLAQDPRPAYQDDDRLYGMHFAQVNVRFRVEAQTASIVAVERAVTDNSGNS